MEDVLVITPRASDSTLEADLGADVAERVRQVIAESLLREHADREYDTAVLDVGRDAGDLDGVDAERRVGPAEVCSEWDDYVLISARTLIPAGLVSEAFQIVESGDAVLGTSPWGDPAVFGASTDRRRAEQFVTAFSRDEVPEVADPVTASEELVVTAGADIPAALTWAQRSAAFAPVYDLLADHDRTVSLSVVTSTYERPEETVELVESVRRSVSEFEDVRPDASLEFEFNVVCYEEDRESIRRLGEIDWAPLEVLESSNLSVAGKRDHGIRRARGEYVVSVDSDCVVKSDWLDAIYRSVRLHRFPGAIQGAYYLDYPPEGNWYTEFEERRDRVRFENRKADSRNLLFKRSVYEEMGGFITDHTADVAEDNVMRERIVATGAEFVMDESIRVYHRYPTTMTGNLERQWYFGVGDHYVRVYSSELHRQLYNPLARWIQFGKWSAVLARTRRSSFPVKVWAFRFLQVVAYTLGYLQGIKRFRERRRSES